MRGGGMLLAAIVALSACTDLVVDPGSDPTAEAVYDELWTAFDGRYAPFEVRGVDWDAAFARHRPHLEGDDDALFTAATDLLSELDDGHVTLVAPGRQVFVAQRTFREGTHQGELDLGIVFRRMSDGPFESGAARFGVLDEGFGYVHVRHWDEEVPDLDRVVATLRGRPGVIIDLRHNPGGDFTNGFDFAGRFTNTERLAFVTRTKVGPGRDEMGQRVAWSLAPVGSEGITAPVVVLVNGYTNSAAERTVMALRALPHVTVLGSPTAGNLGEKVGAELSNGWRYSLVPQLVEDPDGLVFEGAGIPPDVRVDNTPLEIESGLDRQLDAAIDLLRGVTGGSQ